MAQLLNETDDDELAMYLAMGLFGAGKNAASAMDALVRCVADDRPEVVRDWAERALGAIGSDAVVALRHAASKTDGHRKFQIESALRRLSVLDDKRFKHLESIGDDALLDLFMHVADYIIARGAASFQRMNVVFEKQRDAGHIGFATSASALRIGIRELEHRFGHRLLNRVPGRKGGVTPEGMKLLTEIREYLSAKRSRLGS